MLEEMFLILLQFWKKKHVDQGIHQGEEYIALNGKNYGFSNSNTSKF